MIVQCEKCGTQYNLNDDKVKPGETKVRCSRCQYVFTIPSHSLTLDEEEIFGKSEAGTEDEFMKEWAKEFTPPSAPKSGRPAPAAPDEGLPPSAAAPRTTERDLAGQEALAKAFATQRPSRSEQPVPDEGPPPTASVPPALKEEALFAEEPPSEGAPSQAEEVLPFKIKPFEKLPAKKQPKVSATFLLVMFLLATVTGALYYWNKMGRSVPAFEFVYEKIYDLMQGKKDQKLFLLYLKGSENTLQGGKVFVIQGKVANRSQETKKFVKVQGTLFNNAGKAVATSNGFCGVTISDADIKKSTYDALKSSFGFIAVGQAQPLPPRQSSPFTIIFFSPPAGASQYQVEIVEAGESG
jgi:predicted Zn finger-like uncharacterized protein